MLNNKSILITGGTGSFGRQFVKTLFENYPEVERVVIFSRDEMKQFEMLQTFPREQYPQLRFFLGDVRDKDRLRLALDNVDTVIHAAALKQVPAAEYNPFEFIKTNVLGAQNLIEACFDTAVRHVVALSTDKAAAPINLYGATKLCADKLFLAANNMKGKRNIKLSVVRYGNVFGSRGSIVPLFLKRKADGILPITDERMTRFSISMEDGVKMVFTSLQRMRGGEIFIPKIPSFRILDLAEAIAPGCRKEIIGIRPGEKIHEEMITENDALNTIECEDHYVMFPSMEVPAIEQLARKFKGVRCHANFKYSSDTNDHWLSVTELKRLVEKYVQQYGYEQR